MQENMTNSGHSLLKRMWAAKYLYLMALPVLLFYAVFSYAPMYGITLAFKEFSFADGITGSPWVGMKYLNEVFALPEFWEVVRNTLIIAGGRLLLEFPVPIIFALLLNEVLHKKLKRFYQTVYTFPHFLSWVIMSGIAFNFLGDMGLFNQMLTALGLEKQRWLMDESAFRWLLFGSNIWKEMGWGTIIYLATISGINPSLYEAAEMDGANQWQKMKAITIPSLKSTIAILFILQVGTMMNAGFDQILNLYNPTVYSVADILDTYIYRETFFAGASFSFSTAVGLFKSVVNCILLVTANYIVRKLGQEGVV
ncbi:ABC transporter permease [Paenibacillus faecalis]|uniref:ABC transporter permease n=1 Tax=Paenibacillus faecalis TaxID=2079532 RepID=UPI001F31CD86|nr:ABC transporter permease subunit [Paenibacillus faecalis]